MVRKDDMNVPERELLKKFPMLTRVPSAQKPLEIEVVIRAGTNPDFKLWYPEHGAGLWVEMKGYPRNPNWFPILGAMTPQQRVCYRVVLISTSKKTRVEVARRLDKLGIIYAEDTMPEQWVADATQLYLNYLRVQ